MSDQVLESAQPVSPATPPTVAGGAASGQPTSPAPVTFTAEQIEYLKPFIEQQAQSLKDRRIPAVEAEQGEIKKTLTQILEKLGQPPPAQPVSSASGAATPAQPAVDYLSIYGTLGLSANDNDVLRITNQYASDLPRLWQELGQLKQTRAAQPPASAAALPTSTGVSAVTSGKPDISQIKDPHQLMQIARETGAKLPGRDG